MKGRKRERTREKETMRKHGSEGQGKQRKYKGERNTRAKEIQNGRVKRAKGEQKVKERNTLT